LLAIPNSLASSWTLILAMPVFNPRQYNSPKRAGQALN